MTHLNRSRAATGCAIGLGIFLTLCLAGALYAAAWVRTPSLHGSVDYVYACAGVNLKGRFRIGYAYAANIASMTSIYNNLSHRVCGFYPRPAFLPLESTRTFQP